MHSELALLFVFVFLPLRRAALDVSREGEGHGRYKTHCWLPPKPGGIPGGPAPMELAQRWQCGRAVTDFRVESVS